MKLVCHITTVHPAGDTRIFHKECKSLAMQGFDVKLMVINGESFTEEGVEVIGIPCAFSGRISRFFRAPKIAYRNALALQADLYHFHDPEFLPWAARLVKKGKMVVYDVHEDLPRQMMSKYWIYKPIRKVAAWIAERVENYYAAKMTCIITVTDQIGSRFSKYHKSVNLVKNYPVLRSKEPVERQNTFSNEICYVGSITPERGITELISALELTGTKIILNLAGLFGQEQYRHDLTKRQGWKQVNELGFADRDQVHQLMERSFAGIVTLHPIPNYLDALPVKMFEYMAAGLPVIASSFPLWREIVEGSQCGICVDPLDPKEIAKAIEHVYNDREKSRQMGENGKKAVWEKYNWEGEGRKLIDVYNHILNG